LDAPSVSPGGWVKEEFESTTDATLEWFAPENGINYFVQRQQRGQAIEADAYLGLTVDNLVRADAALGDGGGELFRKANPDAIANDDALKEGLAFDSQNRVVPTETSYISLVYSKNDIDAPKTLDDLLRPAYEGALITQDPTQSETGLGFLLQTIEDKGEDGYLEYWSALQENGVQILGSWSDAYAAYSNNEAPIVMSYATDQVFAARGDEDMSEHQVAFLNNQGVAYVAGIAAFADSERTGLVDRFTEFMLSPRVQSKVAVLNVAFPIVTNANLPANFDDLTYTPQETISYSYDRLQGNLNGWLDAWSRQVSG
jgi:thiamine transport system substrate-binding protein